MAQMKGPPLLHGGYWNYQKHLMISQEPKKLMIALCACGKVNVSKKPKRLISAEQFIPHVALNLRNYEL